ncbi:hypothetical protein AX14_014046 [Amanita brunnescens Koide BX004]|nr:hypothetical protein AX14_014046 [Amanita brunnescens Koide BX004]
MDSGFVVGMSIGHAIAVSLTCLRLVVKTIKRRLWWNDFWATISLAMLVAEWILTVEVPNPQGTGIVLRQALSLISIWSARLSSAVSIVPLCPQGIMSVIAKRVAVTFGVAAIVLTLSKTVECGLYGSVGIELNGFKTMIAAMEISCDIMADSYLIGAPIYMVCHTKLAGQRRRMLVAISSFNIVTSFLSVARYVLLLVGRSKAYFIAGNAQCATSLSLCNLLVLVTFVYRQIQGSVKENAVNEGSESVTQHTNTRQSEIAMLSIENCTIGAARPNLNVYSMPPPLYDFMLLNIPPRCYPVNVTHEPSISEFAQATHVVSYQRFSQSNEVSSSPSAVSKSIPANI